MFAIPSLVLLVLVDYFKPQEYVPFLAGVPLLYVLTALTLLGLVVDVRLGASRFAAAPQLALAVAFAGWSVATDLPHGAQTLVTQALPLLIAVTLFVLIAHAVQTFRALQLLMGVVLAVGVALAALGVHQGLAPWGCHRVSYEGGHRNEQYDGRPCSEDDRRVCERGDAEPGVDYACERVGLFGTQTVHGRVRFRGALEDPNELALAVAVVVPLAFAFFDRRRTAARLALLLVTVALTAACVVFSRSRGGQVVFLIVLAVYFVQRFGWRGLALGLAVALPIVLLGGRETDEAAGSTLERLGCWAAGMRMFLGSPLIGVGLGQFLEHHYLTAHNSYVLTAAELGFPGMVLWSSVVYVSCKIPASALRVARTGALALAPEARSWALALLAALLGVAGGMLFLSYAYKEALWIYLGLSGALYHAIRRHEPAFRVAFGARDLAVVVGADALVVVATLAFTRLRLG